MPRIDYLKIDGEEVTEATIYRRAVAEINKARMSIDVFTSYLLEVDSEDPIAKQTRDNYLASLLLPFKSNINPIIYRRLIQAPLTTDMEDALGEKAETYLEHIKQMLALKKAGKNVQLWSIDQQDARRPTLL